MLEDGFAADGFYEHVAEELPAEGVIIDVRETKRDGQVVRARVRQVDAASSLPIAAVEIPT